MLQMFYEWCAQHAKPKPTLIEELKENAELLNRDTIERELRLIADKYLVEANKAQARYLLERIKSSDSQ